MWNPRCAAEELRKLGSTYKLYISPEPEFIRETFQSAVDVFSRLRVPCFKVGKDIYGLMRPDKMVAYFHSFDALQETADQLGQDLIGCAAHGVTFTDQITSYCMLSWGID